jgi:hypothetical protein
VTQRLDIGGAVKELLVPLVRVLERLNRLVQMLPRTLLSGALSWISANKATKLFCSPERAFHILKLRSAGRLYDEVLAISPLRLSPEDEE